MYPALEATSLSFAPVDAFVFFPFGKITSTSFKLINKNNIPKRINGLKKLIVFHTYIHAYMDTCIHIYLQIVVVLILVLYWYVKKYVEKQDKKP